MSLHRRRGSALILVMIFVVVAAIIIAATVRSTQQTTRMTHRARLQETSLAGAKATLAGLTTNMLHIAYTRPPQLDGNLANMNKVIHQVKASPVAGVVPVNNAGKSLVFAKDLGPNNFNFASITDPNDPWNGYSTARLDYNLVSFVNSTDNNVKTLGYEGAGVQRRVTIDYIPLYQFAMLYDGDLELHPGPTMDVHGLVHTNGNLYVGANTKLTFHDPVSAVGKFLRYKVSDGSMTADVFFKNLIGTALSYKFNPGTGTDGDAYLDANDANWLSLATDRWNKRVRDQAFGVTPIRPPLPTGTQCVDLIQRAMPSTDSLELKASKFEYQADLVITGDPGKPLSIGLYQQSVDGSGNVSLHQIPNGTPTKPVVTVGEFYDGEQCTYVKTLDVDIDALQSTGVYSASSGKGVVYVSTTPGPNDTYSLASANQDPTYQRDAAGNIKFTTTGTPAQGFPMTVSGKAGWLNKPTTNDAKGNPIDTVYMPAVRVINASKLPRNASKAFGFYTDRPLYLAGNVNTTQQATAVFGGDSVTVTSVPMRLATKYSTSSVTKPDSDAAGIIAKGFTRCLGNDWQLASFAWPSGTAPVKAQATTTNAILLMGNTPSVYNASSPSLRTLQSGGAHNVMRYLEDWTGVTHTFNGSMICLYASKVAVRHNRSNGYASGKTYYVPPNRAYNWDPSLKTAIPPPGMPLIIQVTPHDVQPVAKEEAIALAQ